MADDATDVQAAEITLDDFNADETAEAAPSAAKETKEVVKAEEPKEEAQADDTAAEPAVPNAQETDTEASKGDETDTDKPTTKADERKSQLNTEIRDLVSQRNALRSEVEKANAEVYQPATENELVEQGLTATDAKIEALRQQVEMRDYNDRVAEAQLTLSSESERVLQDFPIFNPESDQYDKDLAQEAAQTLRANLLVDPNSQQYIGLNPGFSTYQFYKTLARASGISEAKGQLKGQQNTEQMLANADTNSSASPPKAKSDPLMDLWKSDD